MTRALITLVLASSLSAMTVCAAVGPAIGRSAEHRTLLVEIVSSPPPTLAISIL